jgi:hypothetical protein
MHDRNHNFVNLNYEGACFKSSHADSDFPVNTTQIRYPFMIAIGIIHSVMNNKVFLLNTTIAILVLLFFIAILSGLILLTMVVLFSLGEYYAIEALIGAVLISCLATVLFLVKVLVPMYDKMYPLPIANPTSKDN